MTKTDFATLDDLTLVRESLNDNLGPSRARVIVELVNRSLVNANLLTSACRAISSDRRIGFHKRAPLGWFGADQIFLSGQKQPIQALLAEMDNWEAVEQEDLVRHWAGARGVPALTRELENSYGWRPRYASPDASEPGVTKPSEGGGRSGR